MQRTLLVGCVALVACKGSERNEDQRSPAPAPVVVVQDAHLVDAGLSCIALDTPEAEQAGIRRLAHRAAPAAKPKVYPKDTVVLEVGKPTLVRLKPTTDGTVSVPKVNADAIASMAKVDKGGILLTAPAHLEGAVLRVRADNDAVVAIGTAGLATLMRFRTEYVEALRRNDPAVSRVSGVHVEALFSDDIDGDGTPELIVYASPVPPTKDDGWGVRTSMKPPPDPTPSLGVIWADHSIALVPWSLGFVVYIAGPDIAGGAPMLFTEHGERAVIKGHTLQDLPHVTAGHCLQTSATEPATLGP